MLVCDCNWSLPREWWFARNHLIEKASNRIEITTSICLTSSCLFWREILCSSDNVPCAGHSCAAIGKCACDSEIHHLYIAVIGDHDVSRLNIAVNDSALMGVLEGNQNSINNFNSALQWKALTFMEDFSERFTFYILHNHVRHCSAWSIFFSRVVNRDNSWVIKRRDSERLFIKSSYK